MAKSKKDMTTVGLAGMGGQILDIEVLTIGAQAESIAGSGGTIPSKTTRIIVQAAEPLHWHPTGTATSTFGHAVKADEFFILEHNQLGASIIDDTPGDQAAIAIYIGGGR